MLGLVNGCFYAMLSLGLSIIFGMLNIINFAHGALYMMGAVLTWYAFTSFGISYWWSLLLVPIAIAIFGVIIERTHVAAGFINSTICTDSCFTFGMALIIEGLFRYQYGVSGLPYSIPDALAGRLQPGVHVPAEISRVGGGRLSGHLPRDVVHHRVDAARCLSARRNRKSATGASLRHQCARHDHHHLRDRRSAGRTRRACWPHPQRRSAR